MERLSMMDYKTTVFPQKNDRKLAYGMCYIDSSEVIKQVTNCDCASACAKMCTGDSRNLKLIDEELKRLTIDRNNWEVDPEAMYMYLSNHFEIERLSSYNFNQKKALEKLLSSFACSGKGSPILIYKGRHWVFFNGYMLSETGEPIGIFIRDPNPEAADLIYYPFDEYFLKSVFIPIKTEGYLNGKFEAFFFRNTIDCITIEKSQVFRKSL